MRAIRRIWGVFLTLAALALCLGMLPVSAGAEEDGSQIEGSNLTWSLNDGTLTISGSGPMPENYGSNRWPWYNSRQKIQAVTIGAGVTSIGDYAFQNCSHLTTVTFTKESQLKTIGEYAFSDCHAIDEITIPAGVISIGDYAFSYCQSLTSIDIPAGVTSIGDRAFLYCYDLQTVTFSKKSQLKTIGEGVLQGCNNLASIDIPASVTTIGKHAFSNCKSLTSINIPAGVTSIGTGTFLYCSNLKTVTFAEGSQLETIEKETFWGCQNLASIDIPAGVTSIGDGAFLYCSALQTVTFSKESQLETVGKDAFLGCTNLTTIYIPTPEGYGGGNWPTGVDYIVRGAGGQPDTTYRHVIVTKSGGDDTCTVTPTSLAQVRKPVTLTATAGSGYYFAGWKVERDSDKATVEVTPDSDEPTNYIFTMPASDVTVTASFEQETGIYIGETQLKLNTHYVVQVCEEGTRTVVETSTPGDSYALLTEDAADGYTLTLHNFAYTGPGHKYTGTISASFYYYAAIFADKNLTIQLEGENSVTEGGVSGSNTFNYSYSCGVYVNGGNLTVTGDGSLTATGGEVEERGISYGVSVLNGTLMVSGGTLTGKGGLGPSSYGVSVYDTAGSTITVQAGGTLTGIGGMATASQSIGVNSGSLTVNGGSLAADGGTVSGGGGSSFGVQNNGGISITFNGGRITATGNNGAVYATENSVNISSDTTTYAWRTQESGEYTCSGEEEYQYSTAHKYLEIASVYTLTVNSSTGGTATGGGRYAIGAGVPLTATANAGYRFTSWTVVPSGVEYTISGNTFTVTGLPDNDTSVTITANFERIPTPTYSVTVHATEGGTASASPGSGVAAGTTVTLSAQAEEGYRFTGWTVDSGGVTITDNQFTMPGGNVTVTARFEPITYAVTVTGSCAQAPGAGSYRAGETVTIHAGSREGYRFAGWTAEGVTLSDPSSASATFTMPARAVAVTARWSPIDSGGGDTSSGGRPTYRPRIEESGGGRVTVRPQSPERGDRVTITAVPDEGWGVDAVAVTGRGGEAVDVTDNRDGTYSFVQPAGRVTIRVTFREIPAEPPEEIPAEPHPFTDVPEDAWYAGAVQFVFENGLMTGTGDTAFSPDAVSTRGQLVTILWRLAGSPAAGPGPDFRDVTADDWYARAVAWAAEEGIVSGYGDGAFGPGDPVTREQLAVMLHRFAQNQGLPTAARADLSGYADAGQISSYAVSAMQWANAEGLLTGTGGTAMCPAGEASRAQIAAILMRFCERYMG